MMDRYVNIGPKRFLNKYTFEADSDCPRHIDSNHIYVCDILQYIVVI